MWGLMLVIMMDIKKKKVLTNLWLEIKKHQSYKYKSSTNLLKCSFLFVCLHHDIHILPLFLCNRAALSGWSPLPYTWQKLKSWIYGLLAQLLLSIFHFFIWLYSAIEFYFKCLIFTLSFVFYPTLMSVWSSSCKTTQLFPGFKHLSDVLSLWWRILESPSHSLTYIQWCT